MRVILLQNIKGLGQIGDIKNVSDGYGRNHLIPRGLVKLATGQAEKEAEALKKKREIVLSREAEKAKEAAEKLKDARVEISAKTSKTGKLFAAITKDKLIEGIAKATGVILDESTVDLKNYGGRLKQAGDYTLELDLAPDIKTAIRVTVKEGGGEK